MITLLSLKGKIEVVANEQDFKELILKHMGEEAMSYFEELVSNIDELKDELSDLENKIVDFKNQIMDLESDNASLCSEIEELKDSKL